MATECEAVVGSVEDGEAGSGATVDNSLLDLNKFQEVGTVQGGAMEAQYIQEVVTHFI